MARATRNTTGREVAPRENRAVATMGDNPFAAAAAACGSDGGGVIFGKFNGNNGDFTYGSNPPKEIPAGSRILVDMNRGAKRGWICWKDGAVVEERMVLLVEGAPPQESALPDHSPYSKKDDGWKEQVSLRFRLLDTGEEIELKMTSRAGIRSFGSLCKEYGAVFRDYEKDDLILVVLDSNSYMPKDKSFGRKYAPIFELSEFVTPDEAAELLGEVDTSDDDEASPEETVEETTTEAKDEGVIPTLPEDEDEQQQQDEPPVQQAAPRAQSGGRRSKRV